MIFREMVMMKKLLLALIFMMAPLSGIAAGPVASGDRPLLMAGKHSLYQRVLSVPGARMASGPGGQARMVVVPFTAYYVYARQEQGGREWLELGTDRHGSRAGWLPGADCIEWNHGLTAAFRDPEGHDRVLLFKDSDSLRRLAGQSDLTAYQRLYGEAVQGQLSADSPVVAMQPPGHIDIQEDFYLVPIHRYEDVYLGNEKARLLKRV
jgi:serine/threonine-protein kinase PpkA